MRKRWTSADPTSATDAAWLVSVQSVVWTACASSTAIVLGLVGHTFVLVALGAIGLVDGVGSVALAYHFHHARRHDMLSERLELMAHRIVVGGLGVVGLGAIVVSVVRLILGSSGDASVAGAALAAVSVVVLAALSRRKRTIARRVPSGALLSDGHLSGVGAAQAAVALVGAATTRWFHWEWADASAALVVGSVAVALAISTLTVTPIITAPGRG
jgi:divalent metal cation (Fe/Co/Zn/Cd) transporter